MKTPQPMGDYTSIQLESGFFFTAGITPRRDGLLQHRGRVGTEVNGVDVERAAHLATNNLINVVEDAVGNGAKPLSLTVYIACAPSFTDHSRIADSCSGVLKERYGSVPARAAVGVCSLPGGAPIELAMTGSYQPG